MIELKSTQANITLKSPTVVGASVDLSNYYTKAETEALIPDVSGFITGSEADTKISTAVSLAEERVDFKLGSYALKTEIPDVSGFALKSEIPSVEGLATETYVNEKIAAIPEVDLSGYALKSEIPTVPTKTSDLTNDSGFITVADVPEVDLSNYALKTEIPDVSGFQTEAQVNTLINNALGVIENGTY